MGKINVKKIPREYQFSIFDDNKLRMALISLSDKYDEKVRQIIYRSYNDPVIDSLYRQIRASGVYERGNNNTAFRRKIVEFPNKYVYDFCDAVMGSLYGSDWLNNNEALKHELVRHWWVVNKLDVDKGRMN